MIRGKETPRIFTPPLRELTPETTHGFAAIAFAEQMMGLKLFPWQEWLLKHALELNEDGTYRFRYVIVLVGRQNGKSLVLLILALWHLFALGSPTVIATAQNLDRSESAWKEAVEWVEGDEELSELIFNVDRGHPKVLEIAADDDIPYKREYRVASASRRGGRGFSGDIILLDELREHQSWDSWSAVTNTMNARPKGQAWAFSNAGDALSIVLRYLRAQAHQRLGWPDGDGDADILGDLDAETEEFLAEIGAGDMTGFFEWSAPPDAKRNDMDAWAQANPSLNWTDIVSNCVTTRAIAAALASNPPYEFETEVLCRWTSMADVGPFPEGSWEDTLDESARPTPDSDQVVCIAVSKNRSRAYIARAAWGEWEKDGETVQGIVGGIAADRAGTDWIYQWLVDNRDTYQYVVVQDKGNPSASLIPDLENDFPLMQWPASDIAPGTGKLFDRLNQRTIKHLPHPGLDTAAMSAKPKMLTRAAFEIDLVKSPSDAAPLQAFIGAVWALETLKPEIDPQVHAWPSDEEIEQWLTEEPEED